MNQVKDYASPDFAWLAPAKLNLFLHITGRREDGYHLLQSVFQFLDYSDKLFFNIRTDSTINLDPPLASVSNDDNIIVKAAKALQKHTNCQKGADITLDKHLPMGGGLGGGSSDAATTLLALNALWETKLSKQELMDIGLTLGADVPVFIFGHSAWAEGVGEDLEAINLAEDWFLVIFPNIHINTGTIFSSIELTRDKLPIKIRDFLNGSTENVCEPVVSELYPEVKEALDWLDKHAEVEAKSNARTNTRTDIMGDTRTSGRTNARTNAKLTGTGACIFASFGSEKDSEQQARKIAACVPKKWQVFVAKGLNKTHIENLFTSV